MSFCNHVSRFNELLLSAFARACKKTWVNYCDVASVHGIKYAHDKDGGAYSRSAWTAMVFVMFFLANRMAYSLYVDFIGDPIRLIIESDHANTAKLLYPAVTVCPASLFNFSKAVNFVLKGKLPENKTADQVLQSLDQSYGFMNQKFVYDGEKLDLLQTFMEINNTTAQEFFETTKWDLDHLFFRCRFQSKPQNCSEIFQTSKAFAGSCFSFNLQVYGTTSKKFKSNRNGMRQGLSFILKNTEMASRYTHSMSHRLLVLIHPALVYPNEYTFRKNLYKNTELLLRSYPIETISSREVWRRLSVEERKCAMPWEKDLKFFREYHRQNCEAECRSSKILDVCGCIPIYLTRSAKTVVCNFEHIRCLSDNYENIQILQKDCRCVDGCEKVEFSVHLTSANFEKSAGVVDPFYDDLNQNFTVVHVFMQSQLYRRIRRDIVWNIVSIAGNLGNCYSVFVGLSGLSVLQFTYYLVFIFARNYYKETCRENIAANYNKIT